MSLPTAVARFLPTFLLAAAAFAQAEPPKPPAALELIQKDELLRHARYLASDELQGRLTGSPGQVQAARYIAAHFEKLGLEPLGDEREDGSRSFVQHYGIKRTYVADESALTIGGKELKYGYAVLGAQPMDVDIAGKLWFGGFGRTRGAAKDLADGDDLHGKIAVVALKGPRGRVATHLSVEQKFGMSFGVLGRLGRTARNLTEAGAEAVLFVQHEDRIGLSDVLNYVAVSPGKAQVEANFPGADPGMGGLSRIAGGGKGLTMVLSVPHSRQVLQALGIDLEAFAAYVAGGDERPEAADDVDGRLKLRIVHDEDAQASNVVAVLRGSDPQLRDQAIVYSAHMDHVGVRLDGDVFNGADDNASGSAGLLAIASAYAKAEQRPRRSVIFLSVSGEELGLWGSRYFSDHPTWPLDKLVADINTDMIGRSGPESGPLQVTVTPSYRHAKYSTIVRDAAHFAEALGMTFTSGDKYYMRSDHFNFARKGIPVVFFCNGEHEDYHQVTDHADKLDGDKMQRIARLAFWTGWHVANTDDAPRNLGRQEQW